MLEAQGDVGIFGGVGTDILDGHFAHGFLWFAAFLGADEGVDVNGLVVQVGFGEIIHSMTHLWLEKIMCYHRVPHGLGETNVIVGEDFEVIFDVLPDQFGINRLCARSLGVEAHLGGSEEKGEKVGTSRRGVDEVIKPPFLFPLLKGKCGNLR